MVIKKQILAFKIFLVALFLLTILAVKWTVLQPSSIIVLAQSSLLYFATLMGIYGFGGFNDQNIFSLRKSLFLFTVGASFGGLPVFLILQLIPFRLPWIVLLLQIYVTAIGMPLLFHLVFVNLIRKLPITRYLVIGKKEKLEKLIDLSTAALLGKLQISEYMNPDPARLLDRLQKPRQFDAILIGDPKLAVKVSDALATVRSHGIPIEYLPDVIENSLQKIPLDVMSAFPEYYRTVFSQLKRDFVFRIMDILLSVIIMMVLLPVTVLVSIFILLGDGRPIFYTQERLGYGGKRILIRKFRTMDEVPSQSGGNPQHRMTRSGKFLRAAHINEIPQLFSVLLGQMSLVGPRPDLPSTYSLCIQKIPNYQIRTKVKPGVTGLAQVKYRYVGKLDYAAFAERLAYDIYYVKNRNLMLYCQIVIMTIRNVFFLQGE